MMSYVALAAWGAGCTNGTFLTVGRIKDKCGPNTLIYVFRFLRLSAILHPISFSNEYLWAFIPIMKSVTLNIFFDLSIYKITLNFIIFLV
jgi:hypothetical protein